MSKDRGSNLAFSDMLWRSFRMFHIEGRGRGCDLARLRQSRSIEALIVGVRETIALLAIERYGYAVKELAEALHNHPGTASRWIGRALNRKNDDEKYRSRIDKLDQIVPDLIVAGSRLELSE